MILTSVGSGAYAGAEFPRHEGSYSREELAQWREFLAAVEKVMESPATFAGQDIILEEYAANVPG